MKRVAAIAGLVLSWLLFFMVGLYRLDPDFGFHYRWGHDLLKSGWVWHDQYSYTIPSWPEVRHDWLTNVWMASVFDVGGMPLLSAVFASLSLLSILIAIRGKKIEIVLLPILLTLAAWLPRAGVRPQVQDWLLIIILLKWLDSQKRLYFLPLLFMLWVNLHGGFVMGLVLLAVWVAGICWSKKRIWLPGILLWIICFAASGANPYGFRVWEEVWLTLSDSNLRKTIVEWLPFYYNIELSWWMIAATIAALGIYLRRFFPLWKAVICAGLFVAALGSSRNSALFAAASLVFLPELLETFVAQIAVTRVQLERTAKIWGILVGFSVLVLSIVIAVNWPKSFFPPNGERIYPHSAISFLRSHPYAGNLFSNYSWGGYLIWKYPEKKLFIDGRMPSWRKGNAWPFMDYIHIIADGKIEPYFTAFDIEMVLWPTSDYPESTPLGQKFAGMLKQVGFSLPKSGQFLPQLEKAGWTKIYEDQVAVVYRRPVN